MFNWDDFINDFPYTNFNDINVSWFLNKFKQVFDEWQGLYNQMLSWKTATDKYNANWREEQEQSFQNWENNFQTAIDAWKAQTETDINNWEQNTITNLESWKSVFITEYNTLKAEVEQIALDAENAKNSAQASATSAQQSADSASATALALQASLQQINTNTGDISNLKTQFNTQHNAVKEALNGTSNISILSRFIKGTMRFTDKPDIVPATDQIVSIDFMKFNADTTLTVDPEYQTMFYYYNEETNKWVWNGGYRPGNITVQGNRIWGICIRKGTGGTDADIEEFVSKVTFTNTIGENSAEIAEINSTLNEHGEDISEIENDITNIRAIETTWTDGFWSIAIHSFNTDPTYLHSDYIPINQIAIPIHYKVRSIYTAACYVLFDENKQYIYESFPEGTTLVDVNEIITDFKGAKYIVFGTYKDYPDRFIEYCNIQDSTIPALNEIRSIIGDGENNVILHLPDKYDAVVGDTIQIFYKGIIKSPHPEVYDIKCACQQGNAYARYFELTPTAAGNISATFTLYGINNNVLDEKTITFAVKAKPSNPSAQRNILCVGDSLTNHGIWVTELNRRLTGSGGTPAGDGLTNINFIGTCGTTVHFEGYGGWKFSDYNTAHIVSTAKIITCSHDKTEAEDQHSIYEDANGYTWKLETIETGSIKIIAVTGDGTNFPTSGTLTWISGGVNHSDITYTNAQNAPGNPFWNDSENKVDFAAYANNLGVSSIDYVLVLLGWNATTITADTYKSDCQTFINNVHAAFPNAKVILMGLEIPARDGLGANYGARGAISYYFGMIEYVFNLDDLYNEVVSENNNVYSVNLSGQFDTEYNMLTSTRQVNTRNTQTITYQSNGVHPAQPGYYQIADAFYRKATAILS